MPKPTVFRRSEIEHRCEDLPENGTFRLVCDGESYELSPGDMMLVPKDNHIKYETDDRCMIFYAAWPVGWKQQAGLTEVPGIDPEDM